MINAAVRPGLLVLIFRASIYELGATSAQASYSQPGQTHQVPKTPYRVSRRRTNCNLKKVIKFEIAVCELKTPFHYFDAFALIPSWRLGQPAPRPPYFFLFSVSIQTHYITMFRFNFAIQHV